MVQERSSTPEKQLLKLIEDPKGKSSGIKTNVVERRRWGLFSLSAWIGRISFFKGSVSKTFAARRFTDADIRFLNTVLLLCVFGVLLFVISNVYVSLTLLEKGPDINFEAQKSVAAAVRQESLLKVASFYLERVRQRDIFKIGEKIETAEEEEKGPKPPSGQTMEIAQHLKLVGISWSDDPDAMVEDTRALRTYFVKRGEAIGEFIVHAIFKDKIILRRGTEEVELK